MLEIPLFAQFYNVIKRQPGQQLSERHFNSNCDNWKKLILLKKHEVTSAKLVYPIR